MVVPTSANPWLFAGGMLSAAAGVAHVFCIFGGAKWYRFFGAGERLARQVEQGRIAPALITSAIAAILAAFALYAFALAGVSPSLPHQRTMVTAITALYLIRAAAFPAMLVTMPDRTIRFLISSSLIVLAIGLIHLIGLMVDT